MPSSQILCLHFEPEARDHHDFSTNECFPQLGHMWRTRDDHAFFNQWAFPAIGSTWILISHVSLSQSATREISRQKLNIQNESKKKAKMQYTPLWIYNEPFSMVYNFLAVCTTKCISLVFQCKGLI